MPPSWHQAGCCCGGCTAGDDPVATIQPDAVVSISTDESICAFFAGPYSLGTLTEATATRCTWRWYRSGVSDQPVLFVQYCHATAAWCASLGGLGIGFGLSIAAHAKGEVCPCNANAQKTQTPEIVDGEITGVMQLNGDPPFCDDSIATITLGA